MAKFWELFAESVILQAVLALMFGGTVCYLYIAGREVPEALAGLLGLIIGFYFRSKASVEVRKSIAQDQAAMQPPEE